MSTRSVARVLAVVSTTLALALSACGSAPGEGNTSSAGQAAVEANEPAAMFANVDASLVTGLAPTVYTDDSRSIRAEVPVISTARQMTSAMEVLRERGLREATWDKAEKVTIGYQVISAAPGTLGIMVTPTWTAAGAETSRPTVVWYDAGSKKVFSSPVLIREDQWGAFKAEVAKAAGKHKKPKLDETRVNEALDADPAPQGSGPMLGFDAKGDMVVSFTKGTVSDDVVSLRVPGDAVSPLLSEFGRRAADGALAPAAFDGTPAPMGDSAGGGGQAPAPAATPGATRPSTAVGPDCTKVTCVALTYDDGPVPDTAQLVDAFAAAKAPATFFQLGRMIEANPGIAKQIASAGHEVGSHSFSHPNLVSINGDRLTKELSGNADVMEHAYGRRPLIMRPPYGSHNARVDDVIRGTGAAIIQWDVDTNDWQTKNQASTENVVVYGGGAKANTIVLMHDVHPSTVAAAPAILEGLQAKGVTLVTVSELSLNTGGYQAGHAYCSGTAVAKQSGFNCAG
ncbi:polysaccharide deacetylase family protein [Ammonicoccus fulvus]|uniref:Polysaccharide deacetylase family protein n=1 Tax=Ammonicoccus fulvus TaxID=3138240 RepID=A0ABZ3FPX1_9ACTN